MANEGNPVQIPAISLVHGSQALTRVTVPQNGGKSVPLPGNAAAATAAPGASPASAANRTDVEAQVSLLNKYLNESGRPAQFRVDPNSNSTLIQEINPASGAVIAEYPAITFPELARSLGVSGALIDARA